MSGDVQPRKRKDKRKKRGKYVGGGGGQITINHLP